MTHTAQASIVALTEASRWNLIKQKALRVQACKAFSLFREEGIEPILIKGLAAARYYPDSEFRDSVDMDLAVAEYDFERALVISNSAAAKGLAIDLHRELRHLDTFKWDDLVAHSTVLEFETGSIRVLGAEDHLRVLCVHWLTDGGSNKDRLWDIYFAVENRPADFDWDRFLNLVENNRRRWLICTLGLANRFLGLDLTATPVEDEASSLPSWLIKTVEREWASETKFWPLFHSVHDPSLFLKQIRKRLPPNPICATVLMEGSFDAKTRIFYQVGTSLRRIGPSIINISKTLLSGSK
ncbi:MAG: nucleotidyltransferase family protein [Pyrinomonadaceae bacterium]